MKWKKTPPKRETGAGGEGVREISERQEEGGGEEDWESTSGSKSWGATK